MFAGSHDAQQMWQQQVDPAYIQQMQAYAQMYSALGVAPDGTLLAAGTTQQYLSAAGYPLQARRICCSNMHFLQ